MSTLEVVIALSVFLVVAVGLAGASVRLAASAARNEARLATVSAVDSRLEQMAGTGFDELIAGTFTAPDPCGRAGTADGRRSCVEVAGRTVQISYNVDVGDDPIAGPGESGAWVELTASAVLPDGSTVSRDRRVPAPSAGYTADGSVVRVRAADPHGDLPPVSVLDAQNDVVVEGVPFIGGAAVVRIDSGACSGGNAPCRIALSTDPDSWWRSGEWTLTPASITGSAGEISAVAGTLTESIVDIEPIGTAKVRVLAQPNGKPAVPGAPEGTVCVWASFSDGTSIRHIPYCNTGAGSDGGTFIPIGAWPSADGSETYPFPDGFTITVSAAAPEGECPAGTLWNGTTPKGATAGGVVAAADVCSTWTWGFPTSGGPDADTPVELSDQQMDVTTGTGGPVYKLIWVSRDAANSPVGMPAGGDGSVSPWSKPRDASALSGGCATDGNPATSCAEISYSPPPELAVGAPPACATNPFCFSVWNQPPRLTSPGGPYTIAVDDPVENVFTLSFTDPDSASLTMRVTDLPVAGTLTTATGGAIVEDAWMGPGTDYGFVYVRGGGFSGLDTATVEVSDGTSTAVYELGFYSPAQPWTVTGPEAVSVAQSGGSVDVAVRVTDTTGVPSSGVTPAVSGGDLTVGTPTSTDAGGYSHFSVSAGAVAAGGRSLQVTAGARVLTIPITVTSTPATVAVTSASGGAQGASGTVTATVQDVTGTPITAGTIAFSVTTGSTPTTKVRAETGRCVTDVAGSCSSVVRIDTSAKAGTYTITASSGAASDTADITVTQTPGSVVAAGGRNTVEKFTAATTSAGPLRWFRLDDASGTTAVDTTGGDNGTYSGSPGLGVAPLVAGGTSSAVSFDGENDTMCADDVDITTDATVEAWVNFSGFTNNSADPALIWGISDDDATFALVLGGMSPAGQETPRTVRLIADIGGTEVSVGGSSPGYVPPQLNDAQTYHLVGVRSGSVLTLYIDGEVVAQTTVAGALSADGTWCAGASGSDDPHVVGVMDEISVYDRALTPTEVASRSTLGRVTAAGGGWISVSQGGSVELPVTVLDGAGEPMAGVSVAASAETDGLSVTSTNPVTTGASGDTTFTVSADADTAAGPSGRVVITAGGIAGSVAVDVSPIPVTISAADITVAAGARTTWAVSVSDGAGRPVTNWTVTASASGGGSDDLQLSGRATTGVDGVARFSVGTKPSSAPSSHGVTFTAGGAVDTSTVTVSAAGTGISTVDGPFRLPSGGTATWTLAVKGTDGKPVPGADVVVGCSGCGLGFGTGETNNEGQVAIEVTDTGGANPEGSYEVAVDIAGETRVMRVGVRTSAAHLSAPATITVPSGGSVVARITATDASGRPVAGVLVAGTGTGLVVEPARTGANGKAAVTIKDLSGTADSVTFTADGASATATVEVGG